MNTKAILCIISFAVISCVMPSVRADDDVRQDDKAKLSGILAKLKTQSAEVKKTDYSVTLPVATAGSRGSDVPGSRLTVLWPEVGISPLTALVRNLGVDAASMTISQLSPQFEDFLSSYPEYGGEPLLHELGSLLNESR